MRPPVAVTRCVWLLGLAGMLGCAASGESSRMGSAPRLLRDGHPRGPGSFCALNPEGCPPVSSSTETTPAFDVAACLKACEAGGVVLETYCRSLPEPWQRQLCWSIVNESKRVCQNMCYRLESCASSTDCPEREQERDP